jgi:ribosomal protein L34E
MRFRPPYRFRSRRDVLRRLPNGNFEKVWGKGLPIPPEEALRQRIVTMEQLTPSEKTRVENYLVAQTKKQRDKVK